MKRVFLLHLIANAVLIVLLYLWLGIRDARAIQIVLTVLLGGVWLAAAAYLHAGTWHWMRAHSWRVPPKLLLRFTGAALAFLFALWLFSLLPIDKAALWTASLLTFKSRKPVTPDSVARLFGGLLWLTEWLVLPVFLFGQWKLRRFWLLFASFLLIGWLLPQRLVHWAPHFKTTTAELLSMLLRWSIAYVLAIAGWLFILKETHTRADS